MKKLTRILAVVAFAAVLFGSLGGTLAYFTTTTQAQGGYMLRMGHGQITETYSNSIKHVVVSNTGDQPIWVRARAFAGSTYSFTYASDGKWTTGADGWVYYLEPVSSQTEELRVVIDFPEAREDLDFNVAVVYETAPVLYASNGAVLPADWDQALTTEGGQG